MYKKSNGKKVWQLKTYRLVRNPICAVPILLFVFIVSLYFTLQAGLRQNYFSQSSLRYESHENYKYYPIEFHGEKIVHLDMKGAPPKVHYLKQVIPIIAKFGATALLIEYDDMFPFEGSIRMLSSRRSYSLSDIETINKLASGFDLKIIPLIQTFSHMEYVLKHTLFNDLREEAKYPTDICPSHARTEYLFLNITGQILRAHPNSTMVHIGAGEVRHLGRCARCKQKMDINGHTPQDLFLSHIKHIATMIKNKHPDMTVLIWDDFFRHIDVEDLINKNLHNYVQPVIWHYDMTVATHITDQLLKKYQKIFGCVWFAGSFKGTSNPGRYLTQSTFHVHNVQGWLGLYRRHKDNLNIRGMILVGWQRYDHFSVLSELLPVSIPTLGITLSLLKGKDAPFYTIPKQLNDILKCQVPHSVTFFGSGQAFCLYPGGTLLDGIILYHEYKLDYEKLKKSDSVLGWLSPYNIKNRVYNMRQLEILAPEILAFRKKFENLTEYLKKHLSLIYQESIVTEWLDTYLEPIYDDVLKLVDSAQNLMKITYRDASE